MNKLINQARQLENVTCFENEWVCVELNYQYCLIFSFRSVGIYGRAYRSLPFDKIHSHLRSRDIVSLEQFMTAIKIPKTISTNMYKMIESHKTSRIWLPAAINLQIFVVQMVVFFLWMFVLNLAVLHISRGSSEPRSSHTIE